MWAPSCCRPLHAARGPTLLCNCHPVHYSFSEAKSSHQMTYMRTPDTSKCHLWAEVLSPFLYATFWREIHRCAEPLNICEEVRGRPVRWQSIFRSRSQLLDKQHVCTILQNLGYHHHFSSQFVCLIGPNNQRKHRKFSKLRLGVE